MKHPNIRLIQAGCGVISIAMLAAVPALAQTNTPTETSAPQTSMAASASEPKVEKKRHFVFGVNAGSYIPTDSKTRDRFGSSGFSIGLALARCGESTIKA